MKNFLKQKSRNEDGQNLRFMTKKSRADFFWSMTSTFGVIYC